MKDPRDVNEVIVDSVNHLAERGDLLELQIIKQGNGKPRMMLVFHSSKEIPPINLSDYFADNLADENRGTIARGKAGFGSWDEVADAVFKVLRSYAKAAGRQVRAIGL